MSYKGFSIILVGILAFGLLLLQGTQPVLVEADEKGELISKEKIIQLYFNEESQEGSIDLKKIVEEELSKPAECLEPMVVCQIQTVGFDITIKKEWLKISIPELNNSEYANTVSRIDNDIDQLTKSEIVILQETLARRGLLLNLDGSTVSERGFFGPLTKLALLRLAHIKGLGENDLEFGRLLIDEINRLLENMAEDDNYVNNRPLPSEADMTPVEGSDLFDIWTYTNYLSRLAQDAERVDAGVIPIELNDDVNIDGFLNVERVTE